MNAPTGRYLAGDSEPSLRGSALPLTLIAVAVFTGFTTMQSFGIMAETAKAELGLSDQALATVQGVSAAIPLALFSIPIGIWVDRANRVRILIAMALCWTLGTAVTAMAASTAILFLGRLLTAIGTTGGLTAVLSLTADYCRPEQRGRAIVAANVAKTAGIAAGFALVGTLLAAAGTGRLPHLFSASDWRSTQWLLAIGSALLLLPLLLLREPARREVVAGVHAPFRTVLRELWSHRRWLIPMFVGQVSVVMADAAAGIWVAPVLQRQFGLQPGEFAGWLGATVLATGIIGSVIGGVVADVGQKSRLRGGLLAGSLVAAIVGVPCALFPLMPTVPLFGVAVGVLMLAGNVTGMGASVALTVWLPNELRGLGIGAFITVAGLVGFGVAPSLVALVGTLLGGEPALGLALAIVGATVSLVSVLGFWLAMRRAPFG